VKFFKFVKIRETKGRFSCYIYRVVKKKSKRKKARIRRKR